MCRWSIPIIGFPGERGDRKWRTVKQYNFLGFEQSTYIRVKIWTKKDVETIAIRMKKDKDNYWKIDVEKLNRKMIYANRIKNQGVKASKELI